MISLNTDCTAVAERTRSSADCASELAQTSAAKTTAPIMRAPDRALRISPVSFAARDRAKPNRMAFDIGHSNAAASRKDLDIDALLQTPPARRAVEVQCLGEMPC